MKKQYRNKINTVIDYFPYGKVLREFQNGDQERYLTTQHERDAETGLDYRGARYYDNEVARFLSTDPWQDKYPAWSTYNYVMGNPLFFTDPTGKGVTDEYTVDKDGSTKKVKDTDDSFDRLHTKENYDSGDMTKGVKVDKGLLSQLSIGIAESTNKDDFFKVLYFMIENTGVEWGAYGFRQEGSGTNYVMGTSHDDWTVGVSSGIIRSNGGIFNMTFDFHSHPKPPTKDHGASGSHSYASGDHSGDMGRITSTYNRFKEAGMKNTRTWFEYEGGNIKFPSFYVYEKVSNKLYNYTPWDNDIFIRNVNSYDDLYRNLGL